MLTVIAFFFNNNVLPVATLKLNNLKSDIILTRPAFDIREGVFYDKLTGFVIKIGKKDKNDSTIHDVVIYEQEGTSTQDNIIIADSGKMVVTPDKQHLIFTLKHGTRYQEKPTGGAYNSQLVRMSFDTYKKVMDLSVFNMIKTDESQYKGNYQHQTLNQLSHSIDSIRKKNESYIANSKRLIDANLKFQPWLDTTGWAAVEKDTTGSRYLYSLAYANDSIRRVWSKARRERDSIDKAQALAARSGKSGATPTTPQKAPAATVAAPQNPARSAAANNAAHDSALAARAKHIADSARAVAARLHPGSQGLGPSKPGASTATNRRPFPGTPIIMTHPPAGAPLQSPNHPTSNPAVVQSTPGRPSGAAQTPTHPVGTPSGHPAPVKPVIPIPGGIAINRISRLSQPPPTTFEDLLPDSVRQDVMEKANQAINNAKIGVDQPVQSYENEVTNLHEHQIAWHEKLTYAVAVLVMFLIGAPLGSIIRKGGIGMPLVFAVIFFVIFFLLNNFGRKFTKEGVMTAIGGMWMATYVLTPIGIFLTYKAMHDSQLFNKEFYFRLTRSVRKFIRRLRGRENEEVS